MAWLVNHIFTICRQPHHYTCTLAAFIDGEKVSVTVEEYQIPDFLRFAVPMMPSKPDRSTLTATPPWMFGSRAATSAVWSMVPATPMWGKKQSPRVCALT